jgi:hypothetical protein
VKATSAADISAIVDAIGSTQVVSTTVSRCGTPFSLTFVDGKGKTLAEVGLCDSPGLADWDKNQARLESPKDQAGGLTIAHLDALRTRLKAHGIKLP